MLGSDLRKAELSFERKPVTAETDRQGTTAVGMRTRLEKLRRLGAQDKTSRFKDTTAILKSLSLQ